MDFPPAKTKILMIDDSAVLLTTMAAPLRQAGFEVKTVHYPAQLDGTIAKMIVDYNPDLILSDVDMPMLSGDQIVKIIKSSPSLRKLKIFLLSAEPPAALAERAKQSGADGYIPKPKDPAVLVRRVKEILGIPV